jgi:hypothetical protein
MGPAEKTQSFSKAKLCACIYPLLFSRWFTSAFRRAELKLCAVRADRSIRSFVSQDGPWGPYQESQIQQN